MSARGQGRAVAFGLLSALISTGGVRAEGPKPTTGATGAVGSTGATGAWDVARLGRASREILDELLAVDTSHGHETEALTPLARRFERAGLHPVLVESAPGRGNLIVRVPASRAATRAPRKRPLLLLAHVDVVPTDGQPWTSPPFAPHEQDGYLVARGVGDDKSMAAAFSAIVLAAARDEAPRSRDLVLALTAGEETGGVAGVRFLVEHQRDRIDAELALNEGGALILAEGESRLAYAAIGAAEKTYQSFRLTVRGKGGHSSLPTPEADAITRLARALVKVGELRFPAKVLPAAREWLALRAGEAKPPLAGALRHAAAAEPDAHGVAAIAPEDDRVLSQDVVASASTRTTCVATQLEGSPADNVLPTTAGAVVNCRILPDETTQATRATLAAAIADPAVEIAPLEDMVSAPASPVDGPIGDAVTTAVRAATAAVFGADPSASDHGTPATIHTLGTGATDSRHLRRVGIASYGLAAAPTTLSESTHGHGAHGPDERRPLRWLGAGTRWLAEVVRRLAD